MKRQRKVRREHGDAVAGQQRQCVYLCECEQAKWEMRVEVVEVSLLIS